LNNNSGEASFVLQTQPHLDLTFVALADQTRRAILQQLRHGEARVTELAQPYAMSLNAVSKHIRVLEQADLISRRRAGREHFLSLKPAALDEIADWIATQRTIWTQRLDLLEHELNKAAAADEAHSKKGSDHEHE
jgi:DNA-binding transcriptional ArsR family regulator